MANLDLNRGTNIAAIDAGSNAIRLLIARAQSATAFRELKNERVALRLGRHVFLQQRFDGQTIDQAVEVFRRFKSRMNQYDVQRYRAVGTSATREARNRKALVDRIYHASGIRLEVIDGAEEARLVRSAVLTAVGQRISPRLIVDLGGGSLQISLLRDRIVEESLALPLGTVRLMESFEIQGPVSARQSRLVKERVQTLLRRFLPSAQAITPSAEAVWCGGNAEALALLAPGKPVRGIPTLNLSKLQQKLPQILRRDVLERMNAFLVRKDTAEVMGIASLVFVTLARSWNLKNIFVPGVGVKEGVLGNVLRSVYESETPRLHPNILLASARRFATRLNYDSKHCEQVRQLAVSLFDQLRPVHGMGDEMRVLLQLGALLHDIGHAIRRDGHHKHGEYLVRHGDILGLDSTQRDMLGCMVRYHSESRPNDEDNAYASLPPALQRQVRALVSLLRIADRLDCDHRQSVSSVRAKVTGRKVFLNLQTKRTAELVLWAVARAVDLFQAEFDLKVHLNKPI